ncbi:polycomb complex protein BMI-1 isoform X4 [Ambystoma mexicanum]|uniref:polycomb complex protein BMI-1 isoform X4 n=1 Tax=Ambystoma mexicanum TaxID=8296 RepID=UPI0037E91871
MELAEATSRGLQLLADPGRFDMKSFAIVLEEALRGLSGGYQEDAAALDRTELQHVDPMALKHCHAAATACLLEAAKRNTDISTLSAYLEDCQFDKQRIEHFCNEYKKNKFTLDLLLGSLGRCPLHITDVSWRLQYQLKSSQVHKTHRPEYLVNLNVENTDPRSHSDIRFNCSMEQLQDMVGKLKDAAKSLERTTQM